MAKLQELYRFQGTNIRWWCKSLAQGFNYGMMAKMIFLYGLPRIFFSLGMCTTSWFYILFEIDKFGVRLVFLVTIFDSEKFLESVTWAAELSSDCCRDITLEVIIGLLMFQQFLGFYYYKKNETKKSFKLGRLMLHYYCLSGRHALQGTEGNIINGFSSC